MMAERAVPISSVRAARRVSCSALRRTVVARFGAGFLAAAGRLVAIMEIYCAIQKHANATRTIMFV